MTNRAQPLAPGPCRVAGVIIVVCAQEAFVLSASRRLVAHPSRRYDKSVLQHILEAAEEFEHSVLQHILEAAEEFEHDV
ncbi:hypothetical protein D3C87_2142560 [compost metagenome]